MQGTIKRQVVVEGNQIAFEAGEQVNIENVTPNPQNPSYKYVVFSQRLQKRFQLSDADLEVRPQQQTVPPQYSQPRDKSGKGKWILIGAGILVLLIIIIAVASGGKKESPKSQTSTPQASPAQTESKDTYAIGETAKDENLAITVYSFTPSSGVEFFQPTAGNQYIVVDLGIDNNGTDTAIISTVMEMSIRTPDGRKYDQAMYFPEPKYPDGSIQPGGKARGNVAFEVPANTASMEFVFESLTGDPVRFKLQ